MERRAVSEVVGVALISVILVSIGLVWLATQGPLLTMHAYSIIDQIRAAERRQSQLLTLLYYYRDGQGTLTLYIYNYGAGNSTISRLFVGDSEVNLQQAVIKNAETGQHFQNKVIPPRVLAEVNVPNAPSGRFIVFLMTEEGGRFAWEVHV